MELWLWAWQVSCLALMPCAVDVVLAQIRYMIPEELEHGAFVGNIAEDLGLDANKLSVRRFRIVSGAKTQYLEVNLENGFLFVNERIDREELCEQNPYCSFHLQVVIENPLELYRVEVEIVDVNDNSPLFQWSEFNLDVSESAIPGSRFPLESAQDGDVGANSIRSYLLSVNEHFILDVQTRSDGTKFAELVLQSPLDREKQNLHLLVLTAVDGGAPERSGTAQINVGVLDANDNVPVFDQNFYNVKLSENAQPGTVVIKLNATDLDEGPNGEILYCFSGHAPTKVRHLFSVDAHTGEVKVKGPIDFEKARMHEIYVQAKDRGPSAVAVHCKVMVDVLDANDNLPEVVLTSVSTPVQEDAPPGTVIAVISLMDQDSGDNGNVDCEIPHHIPFQLHSSFKNYYTLVTCDFLDRETVSEYNITLTARDMGSPPLFTRKTLLVQVSDINDNAPRFKQPSYTVYLTENNAPGASMGTITAQDADSGQNSYLSYRILDSEILGMPVSSYVSIHSDSGNIYAQRSFDHEHIRSFHIVVQAEDAGFPPLSSNVTVNLYVLDQNDNPPVIVAPVPENDTEVVVTVPRYANAGYQVAKITATDADSGQNSRLFYEVLQATDLSLFSVALYTGEIRTRRRLMDNDPTRQRLVVLVKDNGQLPLSATASIILSVVDNVPESLADPDLGLSPQYRSTLFLIVSLGAISFTFLVAIIVLATIKGYRDRNSDCSLTPGSCCGFHSKTSDRDSMKKPKLKIHISPGSEGPTHCVEVNGNDPIGQNYFYKMCLTPESSKSDFMFLKPCRATGTMSSGNNLKEVDNKTFTWSPASQGLITKKARISPNELMLGNKDRTLNKNQLNHTYKSHSTLNTGSTLQRRMMQDSADNYAYQSVPHYWTWGNHMHNFKSSPKVVGLPNCSWTPRYKESPLDYQHNVYIPGTPSTHCTLKVAYNGDLEVYNSFSTFGKKKKPRPNNNCREDAVITNDFFK